MSEMMIQFEAGTSIGSRDKNQDAFMVDTYISSIDTKNLQTYSGDADPNEKLFVCAVCDGIGMFKQSGKAAQCTLEAVRSCVGHFRGSDTEDVAGALHRWVEHTLVVAKDAVTALKRDEDVGGCTIVLLAIYRDCYILANLGDSPAFLMENEAFSEISTRHTMANLKRLLGQEPTEDENGILIHYLGEQNEQKKLIYSKESGKITKDSCFFLCSDGVFGALGKNGLKDSLSSSIPVQDIVRQAGERPLADNCTAILVRFAAKEQAPMPEDQTERSENND